MPTTPLTVLLAKTWTALVIETDSAFEAATPADLRTRFRISFAMWANGIRLLDDGTTVEQLAARAHARADLPGLERWGWVRIEGRRRGEDGFGTARGVRPGTGLRPTRAGAVAQRLWPEAVAAVEARWRSRFGAPVVERLLAAAVPDDAPWSVPEVHPRHDFRTEPVDGPVDGRVRPLAAVLGGALTARTVEAERIGSIALPLEADLLHALLDGPLPMRELPATTGLAKEGVAMLVTAARRLGLVEDGPDGAIRLTRAGRSAAERPAAADGEGAADLRSALETVLARADALREGLRPPPGTWRGERPHLARTTRLLADPVAGLPRHPVVLHRGGWPDAS